MEIKNVFDLKNASPNIKYLGLPLNFNASKKIHFQDIQQKISQKLARWKAKLLSQASRTTLIRSVASSISSYFMLTISIPKTIARSIDRDFMKFWWEFSFEKNHNLTLKSWKSICKPKSMGDLGIKLVSKFNKVFLCKIGWQITMGNNSIWTNILTGKYLKNTSFLIATQKPIDSWIRKGIIRQRDVLKEFSSSIMERPQKSGLTIGFLPLLFSPQLQKITQFKLIPIWKSLN